MVILDTDLLSLLIRSNDAQTNRLRRRIDEHAHGQVATTIVSYEEQMRGWLAFTSRARTVGEQIRAYGRFSEHVEFYRLTIVAPFDELAAVEYQRLKSNHIRVGTMDLKIAAIVLSRKATLLSRNLKDFRQVPNLDVQDWSA